MNRWSALKPHYKALNVTKKDIKATITTPTARSCKNIYKALTISTEGTEKTQIILLLFYDSVLTYKGLPCTDFGIGDVVASTTSMTTFEDTFTRIGDWIHLPTLTDELTLHQFGVVCRKRSIFVFIFKNIVSINFYIQMESNQDSTALAQQVHALTATIEELTRNNQEMKLRLQQIQ